MDTLTDITPAGRAKKFEDRILGYSDDGPQEDVIDLLADAMHYCAKRQGLNFEAALETARRHFEEESREG